MTPTIAAVIPAHPARVRNGMLQRAIGSTLIQSLPITQLSVVVDNERLGAPATRQRALDAANTEWVAFCDSDDFWDRNHLELLHNHALHTGADYVFSYWHGPDVLGHFGKVFDPDDPVETTITVLVRTGLAKQVGFQALPDRLHNTGEDRFFTLGCIAAGAKIVHLPQRTWTWVHHGMNTSGLPTKGDAV